MIIFIMCYKENRITQFEHLSGRYCGNIRRLIERPFIIMSLSSFLHEVMISLKLLRPASVGHVAQFQFARVNDNVLDALAFPGVGDVN